MTKSPENTATRVVIKAPLNTAYKSVLTPEAQSFLFELHSRFNETRKKLLATRSEVQAQYDAGKQPDFCPETKHIRDDDTWHGPPLAPGLVDRRVEITGPVDRKLVINALNSRSTQFMADLEDSHTPTWANCLEGQINLRDAVNGTIEYISPEGKKYVLNDTKNHPIIIVRPRGWHLQDSSIEIDGTPISGSLFDFGLYFFHNAKKLLADARGPYFYIPKLESYLEARLWNDVFRYAQEAVGIPYGSIRATVLIETLPAAFQMEEIIYELRDHIAGLNAGRWDYIFSFIKKFINNTNMILPDRKQVTMTVPFMDAYSKLLIHACHRRGIHAMGGMSAFIPVRNADEKNRLAFENVRADKEREASMGFDGTWVAHPGLIPVALEVFNRIMPTKNQINKPGNAYHITPSDLINPSIVGGKITEAGVRENITVSIQYMESWLRGIGCVPINNLMEDAATAEISRSQLYQWVKHSVPLDDSRILTFTLFKQFVFEQQSALKARKLGTDIDKVTERATGILLKTIESETFVEFILVECLNDLNSRA